MNAPDSIARDEFCGAAVDVTAPSTDHGGRRDALSKLEGPIRCRLETLDEGAVAAVPAGCMRMDETGCVATRRDIGQIGTPAVRHHPTREMDARRVEDDLMFSAASKDPGLSDTAIVLRASAGDGDAFAVLMRRFNQRLYRTARSILRDDAEAEDALQEAYLLAFRNLEKFRGASSLSTWLTRIVVNCAIARSRRMRRQAEIMESGSNAEEEGSSENPCMGLQQPDQAAERAQLRRLIEQKIDALPEGFRTVFVLRGLEEMTVEDTAACLGIPDATVRTRYFRARALLRDALSREIDFAQAGAFAFDGARCDRIVRAVLGRLADCNAIRDDRRRHFGE